MSIDEQYEKTCYWFDPQQRMEAFRQLVDEDTVQIHPHGAFFTVRLPEYIYERGQDMEEGKEKAATWLNHYFPNHKANIKFTPYSDVITKDNKTEYMRRVQIIFTKQDRDAFELFWQHGISSAPDYSHLLNELQTEESQRNRILEVAKNVGKLPNGNVTADFSVVPSHVTSFCDRLRARYENVFTQTSIKSPFTHIGATISGEGAQRFLDEYQAFKGQQQ